MIAGTESSDYVDLLLRKYNFYGRVAAQTPSSLLGMAGPNVRLPAEFRDRPGTAPFIIETNPARAASEADAGGGRVIITDPNDIPKSLQPDGSFDVTAQLMQLPAARKKSTMKPQMESLCDFMNARRIGACVLRNALHGIQEEQRVLFLYLLAGHLAPGGSLAIVNAEFDLALEDNSRSIEGPYRDALAVADCLRGGASGTRREMEALFTIIGPRWTERELEALYRRSDFINLDYMRKEIEGGRPVAAVGVNYDTVRNMRRNDYVPAGDARHVLPLFGSLVVPQLRRRNIAAERRLQNEEKRRKKARR